MAATNETLIVGAEKTIEFIINVITTIAKQEEDLALTRLRFFKICECIALKDRNIEAYKEVNTTMVKSVVFKSRKLLKEFVN